MVSQKPAHRRAKSQRRRRLTQALQGLTQGRRLFNGIRKTHTSLKTRKSPKTVRFTRDTKEHDGLHWKTLLFNRFMRYLFKLTSENIALTLVKQRNWLGLQRLLDKLEDLISRCEKSPTGRAPILLRGGRDSAGAINTDHLPYLRKYIPRLKAAIEEVRIKNPSQKEAHRKAKRRKRARRNDSE